jgi:hypothetical protein
MRFRVGRISRVAIVTASLLSAAMLTSDSSARPSSQTPATGRLANFRPEVRLRKLHLVRPDLIPYPIDYDYYC